MWRFRLAVYKEVSLAVLWDVGAKPWHHVSDKVYSE